MGILDDAIRDHLDLKRRRGTDEPELKRLEDEAFGPPGRPDASGAAGPTASAVAEPPVETASPEITPEDLGLESMPESPPSGETPPPDGPAPEQPPEPQPDPAPDPAPDPGPEPTAEGEMVFHDFAAEEGLVGGSGSPAQPRPAEAPAEPTDPVERALAQPAADQPAEPAASEEPPKAEDTQVHDMAKELDLETGEQSAPPAEEPEASGDGEPALEVEELDIELDDQDLDLDEPEAGAGDDEDGEDVLEETPEFLRDAPESDRLWFEQGKPKDFDFDEE